MSEKTAVYNGYTYTVDQETGTTTGRGEIVDNKAERDKSVQLEAGHEDRVKSSDIHERDEGGHLIASAENGTGNEINVHAQNHDLNTGAYRQLERAELDAVRDGRHVETEKIAYIDKNSERPTAYMVNDTITEKDGTVHTVHYSFENYSNATQQQWNDEVDKADMENPEELDEYGPSSQERSGYSPEEYEAIMSEYDEYDTIQSDFDPDWDETTYDNDMPDDTDINDGEDDVSDGSDTSDTGNDSIGDGDDGDEGDV